MFTTLACSALFFSPGFLIDRAQLVFSSTGPLVFSSTGPIMRAAALGVLFATLLVGLDAYSTCTDHVHEWIRFHGESTTVMQSLLNW